MGMRQVPAAQVADAESRTPEQTFSVSMFSSPEDLYQHAREVLSAVTSHQGLIYKNIPPFGPRLYQIGSTAGLKVLSVFPGKLVIA
ncbi:uncharacterized membrane protein YFL054C [Aspergillus udagawae]|uniref:Uncharacterized membrane protein YFL054C n=1 Tax=Aspergillus udagawae TaxID=91492 RepID=A0A8H3RQQ7_9EURO|nr:uncharacterized membrane protein YFL054C [Aspergillus udagawae]